jgi:polar amino acid transport system substrate-binding protein
MVVAITAAFVLSACGGAAGGGDLLSHIEGRGYILISTDPNYEPQSFLNTSGARPADTKCPSDALTTAEMQGFDVDVATEIGTRMGVETCFATPDWDIITAGNWANKWDVSVGSMTITATRQEVLDFTTAYYYTPAQFAVANDSGITSYAELDGTTLCTATATTYEAWMNGTLDMPASAIYADPPADVTLITLPTDQECAQAISAGRKDFVGYVTSGTVIDANIEAGAPVTKLPGAVFAEHLAASIDKAHTKDHASLLAAVDAAIVEMHGDGTLSELSNKWFGMDITQDPSK